MIGKFIQRQIIKHASPVMFSNSSIPGSEIVFMLCHFVCLSYAGKIPFDSPTLRETMPFP